MREELPRDGAKEPHAGAQVYESTVRFGLAAQAVPVHVDTWRVSKEALAALCVPAFKKDDQSK